MKGDILDEIDVGSLLKGTVLAGKKLGLTYRASRDGWSHKNFLEKCNGGGSCIVVGRVKAGGMFSKAKGNIVGGYNPFGFTGGNEYRASRNAFVFSVDSATGVLEKCAKLGGSENAVLDLAAQGPSFGVEALSIPLNPAKAKTAQTVLSILGNEYAKLPSGGGDEGKSSSGISARRSGVAGAGSSLLGEVNTAELEELEVYSAV
ncbi:hypothetical protein B484DRAFT_452068 [Ochromonadaceae sp. CCMP2298]|nr:hypothetical protein B484DRAFT_452068 [Ochromonadaceae sp. CCMP2298]